MLSPDDAESLVTFLRRVRGFAEQREPLTPILIAELDHHLAIVSARLNSRARVIQLHPSTGAN